MVFVVLKSYDGGKRWERAREDKDFASAARAALALGATHPYASGWTWRRCGCAGRHARWRTRNAASGSH